MSGWKGQREKLGEGREFHLVRFTDTSLVTLKNILLPGNFATILIFFHIYLAPFIWLDTSRKMGSLIFFFFSSSSTSTSHPQLGTAGSSSGYDLQCHRIRAARLIFQKHELDHARTLLQIFNGSPLCTGPHLNTRAWCSSTSYFSDLISYLLFSQCPFGL